MPLTLVSAPAGYGKSVLIAQWAHRLESPVAWLSLDAGDSELRAFLQYFLAAVETVSPGACDATHELLAAGSLAPVPVLAGYLINDLDAMDAPCSIVLDDYHRIDPRSPVHDLMLRMLVWQSHWPPLSGRDHLPVLPARYCWRYSGRVAGGGTPDDHEDSSRRGSSNEKTEDARGTTVDRRVGDRKGPERNAACPPVGCLRHPCGRPCPG